jgi:imidazole glycerol phosphate synthase subunit hisF (EC 4.1.3.-)
VDANVVVKGVNFEGLRVVGDPVELANRYEEEGADEIFLLDVTATLQSRATFLKTVHDVASAINIPLGVGGGIRSIADADAAFKADSDKVSVNTAAVKNPEIVSELARRGFVLRNLGGKPLCQDCLRATVPPMPVAERLLDALNEVVRQVR